MTDQITLRGTIQYNTSYPPKNAKKGYVARITGRAKGAVKFERDFLGSEVTLMEGDEGFYEVQRGDKKGGHTRWYYVVLNHPEHGVVRSEDCEDDASRIAKLLDEGVSIEDAVEMTDFQPHSKCEDRMIFTPVVRTKTEAKKTKVAATIEDAVTHCLDILCGLDDATKKKAVFELRKRLNPTL